MGEAIDTTYDLYPGILETNPNLLFMLKCRQFVEMVSGTDSEVHAATKSSSARTQPRHMLIVPSNIPADSPLSPESAPAIAPLRNNSNSSSSNNHDQAHNSQGDLAHLHIAVPAPAKGSASRTPSVSPKTSPRERSLNSRNAAMNGQSWSVSKTQHAPNEECMDTGDAHDCSDSRDVVNGGSMNGVSSRHSKAVHHCDMGEPCENSTSFPVAVFRLDSTTLQIRYHTVFIYMEWFISEVDQPPPKRQFCGGSQQAVERMIQYGRELRTMCEQLKLQYGVNEANEKALKVF